MQAYIMPNMSNRHSSILGMSNLELRDADNHAL
jgi:hypothetical protein